MTEEIYLAKTSLPKSLVQGVIDQFGGWNSFLESYEDVVNHGIDGGFSGFIYYDDTVSFAEKFRKEIVQMLLEDAEDMGCDVVGMVCDFGVFRYEKPDRETKRDIYNYITGFPCEGTYIPNLMAWYAAEKVCNEFYNLNN
jgi:hypothetical protein